MKKRMVFMILFVTVLCISIAFSSGFYSFTDAHKDAETIRAFFHGSGAEKDAAASFDHLYDFFFKDAKAYVLNKNKGKFHYPECSSVTKQMSESNKVYVTCSRDLLIELGYSPCGNCHP